MLLMVLVAYIHGFNVNLFFRGEEGNEIAWGLRFFENFISDGVCRVAVPMFFAISGYLASFKIKDFGHLQHWEMLKKRIASLVIPYFTVSFLGILLVIVLLLIPISKPYFNNFSLHAPLRRWLIIWILSPVPFQLWFIRFLWIYFMAFPLFYFGLKYGKWFFLLALGYFWSNYSLQDRMHISKLEVEGAFFFSLGIFFAIHKFTLEVKISKSLFFLLLLFWLAWTAHRTYLLLEPGSQYFDLVHYSIIGITLSGFFLFWFSYDLLPPSVQNNAWLEKNAPYSIGIFLLHEPFLTIIKKLFIKTFGMSNSSLLISFLLAPAIAFFGALFLARILHRQLPGFYNFLTGNRAPQKAA